MRWHPENEHVMASAHDDGVVRLWDIRRTRLWVRSRVMNAKDHNNGMEPPAICSLGASDGNIVHWDLGVLMSILLWLGTNFWVHNEEGR